MAGAHAPLRATGIAREDIATPVIAVAVKAGDVVVIRCEGPKGGPGMQEMLAGLGSYRPALRQRPISAAPQVHAAMATSASRDAARDIALIVHPDK